jgi:hypothetical protein
MALLVAGGWRRQNIFQKGCVVIKRQRGRQRGALLFTSERKKGGFDVCVSGWGALRGAA